MTDPPQAAPPAPTPVAAIERRIRWRALPALLFLGILLFFVFLALMPVLFPPRTIAGLPDDPDVRAAHELAEGHVRVWAGRLRFASAITGYDARDVAAGPTDDAAGRRASAHLLRARTRLPNEPRVLSSIASLDLVRGRLDLAEHRYRDALDHAEGYGEAHLGLGVTLALRADAEQNAELKRSLELQAIAHFAEVRPRDPVHAPALYDRAILLEDVGRHDEALELSRQYLAHDPASVWSEKLRDAVGLR
jgi:tetratricopeptide (TPR) repeat protein